MVNCVVSPRAWALGLFVGILSSTAASTWATSATFADFEVTQAAAYKFNPTAGTLTTISADTSSTTIPVNFKFLASTTHPAGLNHAIPATLTFTSQTDGSPFLFDPTVYQSLKNVSLTFTALTPISGKSNLLTVSGNLALLSGDNHLFQANLNADEALDPTLTFSSDFMNLSQASEEGLNIDFNGITSSFSYNPTTSQLDPFTAAGNGSFAAAIPEPASLALLALGTTALLRRKR